MKSWIERPIEVRNLFNPAFCGLLLYRAMKEYQVNDIKGMPYSLSLLVLPLVLPAHSRNILLTNSRSSVLKTITSYPELLVGFPDKARHMIPCTLEALGLLAMHDCFSVREDGRFECKQGQALSKFDGSAETLECEAAAKLVGRHFARTNDSVTIYVTLGVRP